MSSTPTAPLRVVQWATGAVGREAIQSILDHPELELVGVKVFDPAKDGIDVGELVGREPVGVFATTDAAAVLALEPDCVSYMPRIASTDEACDILASGANLVTTSFLFHPTGDQRDRVEAACLEGGTSAHGTGLNPGPVTAVLPLAAATMSRSIDRIVIQERADWSWWESVDITVDKMRFGHPPEAVSEEASDFLRFNSGIFQEEVWLLGDALGADLDEVTAQVELALADAPVDYFGHTIETGTVGGQRWRWLGRSRGEVAIEIEALWTVGIPYPASWPAPLDGWTMTIEGTPSMRTHFLPLASYEKPATMLEHTRAANVVTATSAVNAIPALCRAEPGVRTMADLPPTWNRRAFGGVA